MEDWFKGFSQYLMAGIKYPEPVGEQLRDRADLLTSIVLYAIYVIIFGIWLTVSVNSAYLPSSS